MTPEEWEQLELRKQKMSKWWCHLPINTKVNVMDGIPYPECSNRWNQLSLEDQEAIYQTNGGRKAHQHHEWKKGNPSLT